MVPEPGNAVVSGEKTGLMPQKLSGRPRWQPVECEWGFPRERVETEN